VNILKALRKKNGFSLIEMIVVIAIIGILAAIVVPNFSSFLDRGRIATAVTDASQLASNINTYSLTQPTPLDANALSDPTLKDGLIAKNLLPQLSADFETAIKNVMFNPDTRLFEAKPRDEIAKNLDGY